MFKKEFVDVVKYAQKESLSFYLKTENKEEPNPYYIGFGNPNSDILIIGKEKGFSQNNNEQLKCESINNPAEWLDYIENNKDFYADKFYDKAKDYLNAFYPYSGKMKSGHTWTKYNKLTAEILNESKPFENNLFLKHAFISDVNYKPSKYSKIKVFDDQARIDFLKKDFYKSFKTTILGCGDYLDFEKIKDTFDVDNACIKSKPRRKLVIFENGNRKLILTRQLSMDVGSNFIKEIASYLR